MGIKKDVVFICWDLLKIVAKNAMYLFRISFNTMIKKDHVLICGKSRLGSPLSWDHKRPCTYFGLRLMQYEKIKNKDRGQRLFYFLCSLSFILYISHVSLKIKSKYLFLLIFLIKLLFNNFILLINLYLIKTQNNTYNIIIKSIDINITINNVIAIFIKSIK